MRCTHVSVVAAIACGVGLIPVDARPRGPRPGGDHFRCSRAWLDKRTAAHTSTFGRVTLSRNLDTEVRDDDPYCRIVWEGRQVDAFLAPPVDSARFAIPIPTSASVTRVDVARITPDRRTAERLHDDDCAVFVRDSTLHVSVPADESTIIEIRYAFAAREIAIHDVYRFRETWPILRAEYRFSIRRTLWTRALEMGIENEFGAITHPQDWASRRVDDANAFSWTWLAYDTHPDDRRGGTPDSLTVSGALPARIRALVDADELKRLRKESFPPWRDVPDSERLVPASTRFGYAEEHRRGEEVPIEPPEKRAVPVSPRAGPRDGRVHSSR